MPVLAQPCLQPFELAPALRSAYASEKDTDHKMCYVYRNAQNTQRKPHENKSCRRENK